MSDEKCYCCDRRFRRNSHGQIVNHPWVLTIDGQREQVGPDCYQKIVAKGADGYQPPLGGPRLFAEAHAPAETLKAAGIVRS